jgi:hypothetical protein
MLDFINRLLDRRIHETICVNGVKVITSRRITINGKRVIDVPKKFIGNSQVRGTFSWEKDCFGNTYYSYIGHICEDSEESNKDKFFAEAFIITEARDEYIAIVTF